jgi:SAM-dependent methyltransferase
MIFEHHGLSFAFNLIRQDKSLNILDIGAGKGFWGFILKSMLRKKPTITAIEIYPSHIDTLKQLNLYDTIVEGDATKINFISYDLCILSHVVEHIEKEKVYNLISILKNSCKQIIILCPEGNTISDVFGLGQSHISKWNIKDFRNIGMNVKHIPFSNRAGKVVSLFERFYFWLRNTKSKGVLVAWWNDNDVS